MHFMYKRMRGKNLPLIKPELNYNLEYSSYSICDINS
jgi:hypothetical protein